MSSIGVNVANRPVDNLLGSHPAIEFPVVVASGATYKRGHVMGKITTGGKYKGYASASTDGSEIARAILVDDVDASAADQKAVVYVHGEFNSNALIFTAPADATAGIASLFTAGIFCTNREA